MAPIKILQGDLTLFPDPATFETTIELSLPHVIKGQIVLANIAGNQIKKLVEMGNFNAGPNRYKIDLSTVGSGVYLISIITDGGFRTERIIISR